MTAEEHARLEADAESPSERFERLAAAFYRDTGMMAPGKDVGAAAGSSHTYDERVARWREWLAAGDNAARAGGEG